MDTSAVAERIRKEIVHSPLCPSEWCATRLDIYEKEILEEKEADAIETGCALKEKLSIPSDGLFTGQITLDKDALIGIINDVVDERIDTRMKRKPQGINEKHNRSDQDVVGMMIQRINQKKLSIARVTAILGISYQSWYRIVDNYKRSAMLN